MPYVKSTILYNRKSVTNFNVLLVFVGKINLNFYYKKMTEKMYDNLQGKYISSVLQILKIWKAFSNFDLIRILGRNTLGFAIVLK